jgi:hypothetical protein
LFKNIIPIEILAKMPLRFLHILRDIRLKQIREKNERLSQQAASNARNSSRLPGGISADELEELIEEST